MSTKSRLLSLFAILALSSCAVEFPDIKLYSVAGTLQAGADYAYTGHDETGEITMEELFHMLEDGAIIMVSEDYMKQKTAAEQACIKLGAGCSFEIKQALKDSDRRIQSILPKDK